VLVYLTIFSASVIYAWGENAQAQLGLGDYKRHSVPETSPLLAEIGPIVDIACAEKFAIAINSTHHPDS
jgi:alpha-tubulin suppressor-like RCC1 family protein